MEQAFDVEQPEDVEQAQTCGTGPKRWNRGKISNTLYACECWGAVFDPSLGVITWYVSKYRFACKCWCASQGCGAVFDPPPWRKHLMKSQNDFSDKRGTLKRSHHDFADRHGTFKKSDEPQRHPTVDQWHFQEVTFKMTCKLRMIRQVAPSGRASGNHF